MESQTKLTPDTALPHLQQDHSIAAGVYPTTAHADADHAETQTPIQDIIFLIGRSY